MKRILCWFGWHYWLPKPYTDTYNQACWRCGLLRRYLGEKKWQYIGK
jgi:hypothetical protein